MNNIIRALLIVFISSLFLLQSNAEEYKYMNNKQSKNLKQTTAGCTPPSGFDWLDINNVRARINTGGDMWWDLPGGVGPKYFIPANGTATSLFAGALWIGGLDINNQLKLAAQKFRQNGIDYWTGPLTVDGTAAIGASTCSEYDKFFKITRLVVDDFLAHTNPETGAFEPSDDYVIPPEIMKWPAHGDIAKGQSYYLAPFYDVNDDGFYEPEAGDYPYYDVENVLCHTEIPTMEEVFEGTVTHSILADQVIKGDQTMWWIFNDKGDIHTETDGSAIGMEIRAQAFAFATNDVINDMTFYSYEIINRSTFELTKTFFSPWVDPDLGEATDDFVGCDVGRGLGYCYNGAEIDGSGDVVAYGAQPPAIGVDFFQGPYLDPDGIDNPDKDMVIDPGTGDTSYVDRCDVSINGVNFGNDIVDDERYGMRRFVYYNNSSGNTGEPNTAPDYYNYLRGIWKDGTRMQYGGTGHISGQGTVGPDCDFMFPGDSDPCNWGTQGTQPNGGFNQDGFYWTEETGNNGTPNPPGDRRFMQSAGPFTLQPGAVNYITVGIPWARATAGGAFASVEKLRVVDDKCQALFDNCFKVIDGPTAPDLTIRELDKALIIYISNSPISNNYNEAYLEYDQSILQPNPAFPEERSDSLYRFEGYQIFQLENKAVSIGDLGNVDLVRLVAQFDKKNGVTKIVNYYEDDFIGASVPVVEVVGGDNGIEHSFMLTQDAFATKDVALVNNKVYYYMAIAYAYNNYLEYGPGPDNYQGQTMPYLSGRKNIKTYTGMPHKIVNGTVINGEYGESPPMTRLAGNGNGGLNIDLSEETIEEVMSKPPAGPDNLFGSPDYPIAYDAAYVKNGGPVNVIVIDPLNVVGGNYTWWMDTLIHEQTYNVTGRIEVRGDTSSKMVGYWRLVNNETGKVYKSDTTIIVDNEQLFPDLGFSINVLQPYHPGPLPVGEVLDDNTYKTFHQVLADNNGLIEAQMVYSDSSNRWLSGIEDVDIRGHALDWIRSGTHREDTEGGGNPSNNDWLMLPVPPNPWDPGEVYEQMLGGTWTPYGMTAYGHNISGLLATDLQSSFGPALNRSAKKASPLSNIASVDIVFTPDKTKWTRSPILEMGNDQALVEGGVNRFALRAAPSVDKDGNSAVIGVGSSDNDNDANYISDHGMGWFPGYCINVETGERLNIIFGENSYMIAQNGRDMLFNPPARDLSLDDQRADPNIFTGPLVPGPDPYLLKVPVMGGGHYVYIQSHRTNLMNIDGDDYTFKVPAYDAGRFTVELLDTIYETQKAKFALPAFFGAFMYAGMPMGVKGTEWLSDEIKIRIRIAKPFEQGYTAVSPDTVYPGIDFNNYYPAFDFSMDDLTTEYNVAEKHESDLDLINIVPNPYYAYSAYESNALDTRVKITNLPKNCKIIIFDVSGVKVREFTKASANTTLEWDLKNFAGVPISGGVYYIHVKSDEGERVLKWFSIQRVPDLNTF